MVDADRSSGWQATQPLGRDELEHLVMRFPLPAGVPDAVLTREDLALALGTSANTITDWLNRGMPAIELGRNGKPYELRLSHCYAWNQARHADEAGRTRAAQTAIAAMRDAIVGRLGDEGADLDPKQRREILMAQIAHEQLQAQRNRLLSRDDVRDAIETFFALMRNGLESAPDRIERADPTLPPRAVTALVSFCDDLADELSQKIGQMWSTPISRNAADG